MKLNKNLSEKLIVQQIDEVMLIEVDFLKQDFCKYPCK